MSLNIKNPICLIQNKVKKVVVDNVNMTIDVYTSEVPSEEPTPSVPTDLSNYIVYVPSGWSASSGYGQFNIDYIEPQYEMACRQFNIGYGWTSNDGATFYLYEASNVIATDLSTITIPQTEFTIYITGGTDVTNQSLIQWLVDNNATFTYNHSGGA